MCITEILARLHRDKSGLAAVEYALLCGLVVLVMIASLNGMANVIGQTWNHVSSEAQTAVQQSTGG
ncbi:pilus assembly protein Flp/PilA [Novosphingobium sp. SG751A]|uniref:Flp family type IVb pilin n=1 Tax=Novosphingobium sp. SG751A TaxID=2587000 RepID=UPI0015532EE8|nr:Flp family type IVb pilin [Novosphingobium sp. SG751A]NOW47023.1 pilus assembly protein Flp/PilA [Novosphingobium sp. SG751A]